MLVPGSSGTIQDVPVPSGFKYTNEGSWSDVKPDLRQRSAGNAVARLLAEGRDVLGPEQEAGVSAGVEGGCERGRGHGRLIVWPDLYHGPRTGERSAAACIRVSELDAGGAKPP